MSERYEIGNSCDRCVMLKKSRKWKPDYKGICLRDNAMRKYSSVCPWFDRPIFWGQLFKRIKLFACRLFKRGAK